MSSFDLDAVRSAGDDGPVTMLNLVSFREASLDGDGSGWDAYQRYTADAQGYVERVGGKVLWAGFIAEAALAEGLTDDEVDFDWGLLVWYPSRAAFAEMVTSPDYLEANEHRINGVAKHAILASRTVLFETPPEATP